MREACKSLGESTTRTEPIYLSDVEREKTALQKAQATFDSLNALHTAEVGKLAKFGGE